MRIHNTLHNLMGLSVFILISTLYSSLDILAYAAFLILFIYLLLTGKFRTLSRIETVFLSLLLTTILSLLSSIDFNTSLIPSIYFFFIVLFSLSISKSINDLKSFEKFLFFGLMGFLVFNVRNFFGAFTSVRFSGVAGQPNALGLISGTGIIVSISYLYLFSSTRFLSKPVAFGVLLSSFFLILASGSRGAFISVLLPILYLFFRNIKKNFKTILIILSSLIAILMTFYEDISALPIYSRLMVLPEALGLNLSNHNVNSQLENAADDSRLDIMRIAFEAFLNKPLFGNGTNTFSYFSNYVYTHNTYLEILFTQGIFGSVVYLIFLIMTLTTRPNFINSFTDKINQSKNFVLIYFIFAGFSIPNFFNKSQVIIYVLLLISTKHILSKGKTSYFL